MDPSSISKNDLNNDIKNKKEEAQKQANVASEKLRSYQV